MQTRAMAPRKPYFGFNGDTGFLNRREGGQTTPIDGEAVISVSAVNLKWNKGNSDKEIDAGLDLQLHLVDPDDGEDIGIFSVGLSSGSGMSISDVLLADSDLSRPYVLSPYCGASGKYKLLAGRDSDDTSDRYFAWDGDKGEKGGLTAMPVAYVTAHEKTKRKLDRRIQCAWIADLLALRFGFTRGVSALTDKTKRKLVVKALEVLPPSLPEDVTSLNSDQLEAFGFLSDSLLMSGFGGYDSKVLKKLEKLIMTGLPNAENDDKYLETGVFPGDEYAPISY